MTKKRFIITECSIIVVLSAIFALNAVFKKTGASDNECHITMDYYGNVMFEGNDDFTNNVWLRMIKDKYEFTPVIDSAVSTTDYETKLNIAIGANNLSDVFSMNINQFSGLVKNNQIYDDLTDVYDKYASDEVKEAMGWDKELKQYSPTFSKWVVDGKLRAVPVTSSYYQSCYVLYIRKDWLNTIGYDSPRTLDDLETILFKFKDKGLGKGLALNQDILYSNAGSANFLFNAFQSYPTLFVYDENGKVDFGYLRPETKTALEKLQYWYSNGLIYPEFAQTTAETIGNKVASGDIGVIYGDMSLPVWRFDTCVQNFPEADFVCVPAPDFSLSKPTKVGLSGSGSTAYVVKKGYAHPERLFQMMNLYYDSMFGVNGDFERFNKFNEANPVAFEPADKNYFRTKEVKAAVDADINTPQFNDPNIDFKTTSEDLSGLKYTALNTETKYYYRNVRDFFLHGKLYNGGANWAYTRIFYAYEHPDGLTMVNGKTGFDSSFSAIDKYADNDLVITTLYDGVDTPSYSNNRRTIETKILDTMIKIIRGQDSSLFDKTVASLQAWVQPVLQEIEEELAKDK